MKAGIRSAEAVSRLAVVRTKPLLAATISAVLLATAGCGGDEDEAPPTPEEVAERLQDDGYATGEVITDGANVGVARSGELDAEAYLGVDFDPEDQRIYAGIYFFEDPDDAAIMARERERNEDGDFFAELVGERVYEIAGTKEELTEVIASGEAE